MLLFMDKPILQQSPKGFRYMTHEQYHGVCEKPSQVKVKVVFLSAVWYTGQAVKILKNRKLYFLKSVLNAEMRSIMDSVKMREAVEAGKTILGIEFGSTRIKAVLTDEETCPDCTGST